MSSSQAVPKQVLKQLDAVLVLLRLAAVVMRTALAVDGSLAPRAVVGIGVVGLQTQPLHEHPKCVSSKSQEIS